MAIEKKRGCGYRKCGGLYLCGTGLAYPCDRLPINLGVCPVCGHGIKPTMGITRIDLNEYLGGDHTIENERYFQAPCSDDLCPVCRPSKLSKPQFLMFVGSAFYTPESFVKEALEMGVSKRLSSVPKDIKLGKTWVMLAHRTVGRKHETKESPFGPIVSDVPCPAIFYAFMPQRIEKLIWQKDATEKTIKDLEKRGITPVIIPDGDPDHDPKKSIEQDIKEPPRETKITGFGGFEQ